MALLARLLLVALAFALGAPAQAESRLSREYQVKAVFLLRFIQFVEWPESAFGDADDPIRIGVLGEDPFGEILEEALRGETVRERRLVAHRSQRPEELARCHLVFVARSERRRLDEVIRGLGEGPILTVSDIDGFAARGGVIDLSIDEGRVRFGINPRAAKRRKLHVSAQLLSLGTIVEDDGGSERP